MSTPYAHYRTGDLPPWRALSLVGVALFLLAGSAGCTRFRTPGKHEYRTVVSSPNRDLEAAKAENRKAAKLVAHGKLEAAEQALQRALVADVNYGPAHNNLGKVYFQQRKYYLAAWEFEYATRLMPERAEPKNNLGQVFEATGRLEQSIDLYNEAYGLAPQDPEVIGNLVRALIQRDEQDPSIRPLLTELVLYDTRPTWVAFAKEFLATRSVAPASISAAEDSSAAPPDRKENTAELPAPVLGLDDLPPETEPAAPQFLLEGF